MSLYVNHPYHLVDESPWPLLSSVAGLMTTLGLVKMFSEKSISLVLNGVFCVLISMYFWWEDTSKEGMLQGLHTFIVQKGLRWGMMLFIISEVFFFLSFFWAFFHSSLGVSHILMEWPPLGFFVFNPWQVPLLNTLVLLSSGVTVTWSHYEILKGNHNSAILSLGITVGLGFYFTCLQALEYYEATFSLADSVYGGCFFVATGFHGLHVIIGSVFLMVCLWRGLSGAFSSSHHFGFEAAAWYWHFVDVVWLFLFVSIYWWGKL